MNIYQKQIDISKKYIPSIKNALLDTYFSNYNEAFLNTHEGQLDIENNVFRRYDHSLIHVVPWISRHIDLEGKKVLEIGCGTGSSTAAFAHYVQLIDGYDIHTLAVNGARKRLEIMGLNNVNLHIITEDTLIERISNNDKGKYDIILLFAVLEHQTVEERLDTIKQSWQLLAENGVMAVIDTPNILHYFDIHTSKLPFLHMLPNRIYAKYAANSPRSPFVGSFSDEKKKSDNQLDLQIARWGRGVSYHDFEIALGKDYRKYIVAEGFEPEILDWFNCTIEEEILRWYVEYKSFDIPLGFTRCVLNLIFKKHSHDNVTPANKIHLPVPCNNFNPTNGKIIQNLEQKIKEKDAMLEKIYNSNTWHVGSMLATPYRKIRQLFKR